MGTFAGHAIPGTFFAVFGLWWATQLPRRRLLCDQKKIAFFNTATYPMPFQKVSKYPVEGILKMVASVIGMSAELFAGLGYGTLKLESLGDIQHFTMYSFFMLSGVVDCFVYRGSKVLPQGMDYFALIFAFIGEFLLFVNHLQGRTAMDVHVHTCLLYTIAACCLGTALEYKSHSSELVALLRAYVTLLQGTWFFQIGFILYPPLRSLRHWDDDDHDQLMIVTMVFAWHIVADMIVVLCLYVVVRGCYTRYCRLLDFKVEHQLLAHGWTLRSLRLRGRRHLGLDYSQVPGQENSLLAEAPIIVTDDSEAETEI